MDAIQNFIRMLQESAIMRQQVYQLVGILLGFVGAAVDLPLLTEHAETVVDAVLRGLAAVLAIWTMFTRAFKPAPNLTNEAGAVERRLVAEGKMPLALASHGVVKSMGKGQGGSVRLGMLLPLAIVLVGCGFLGLQKPETFEEVTASVQVSVAQAQTALEAKIDAGSISKRDAVNTDAQLDNAIEGLDIAIELREAGDPAAQGKLEATRAIVLVLRKQLGV